MRVIVINDHGFVQGGAAKIAVESVLGLAKAGVDVAFLCGMGPVDPRLEGSAARVVCLDQPDLLSDTSRLRAGARAIWNPAAACALTQLLDESPSPAVVHLHAWCKVISASVVRAAQARRVPLVLTLHDYFTACPNGAFFDYPANEPCLRRPMSPACLVRNCDRRSAAHKAWRVVRQLVQAGPGRLPRGIRHFVSPSQTSLTWLGPHLPASAVSHLIPNPVFWDKPSPAVPSRSHEFIFAGRLAPEKGPQLLAKAARQAGVPVTFVGEGPLQEELEEAGFPVTGWLDSAGVRQRMAHARAVVFPSLLVETFGLAAQEAESLGVPCIVPEGSAAAERTRDGETGVVVEPGSVHSLAAALRRMHNDPALADRLGAAAYAATWAREPGLDTYVERLTDMYRDILASEAAEGRP